MCQENMQQICTAILDTERRPFQFMLTIHPFSTGVKLDKRSTQTSRHTIDISCKTTTFAQICCNAMLMGSPPHLFEALAISCDPKGPAQKHLPRRLQHALKHFSFVCVHHIWGNNQYSLKTALLATDNDTCRRPVLRQMCTIEKKVRISKTHALRSSLKHYLIFPHNAQTLDLNSNKHQHHKGQNKAKHGPYIYIYNIIPTIYIIGKTSKKDQHSSLSLQIGHSIENKTLTSGWRFSGSPTD